MRRKRVLVVDDSVVARKIVSELLASEPSIESVTTAANGRLALEKLSDTRPDLVILDIAMPELDGLATLRELRTRVPDVPVLMFSGLTERAGALTLDALSLGASDYVTKPMASGGAAMQFERVREELLAKARALLTSTPPPPRPPSLCPAAMPRANPLRAACVEVLAIGASTGGPSALAEFITALPSDLPVPVVIAVHMPPVFTRLFAERLERTSTLRVREGVSGTQLRPGEVWIAPGDFHLTVVRDGGERCLAVHQGASEHSCRPSVDVLFRSIAAAYGPSCLGVILTGMGTDGLQGSELIRRGGGQIVVQDEASSVVWSMPGAVAKAGLADEIVSIDHMAPAIIRRLRRGRDQAVREDRQ